MATKSKKRIISPIQNMESELKRARNIIIFRDKTISDLRATVITLTKQLEAAKKPWWRVW